MSEKITGWISALAALGGLFIGLINLARTRSMTKVEIRWEMTDIDADVPFLVDPRNFEESFRLGAKYLHSGLPDTYTQPIVIKLIVRVSHRGIQPINVEYVELGDDASGGSYAKAPGQEGSAVRAIDPNSHYEWRFDFNSIAAALLYKHPSGDYSDITLRVATGAGKPKYLKNVPQISKETLKTIISAGKKVWPEFPQQN